MINTKNSTDLALMYSEMFSQSDSFLDLVILVCVIVGLVFFSLGLLTFALYKWSPARDWIRGFIVHGPEGYNREE